MRNTTFHDFCFKNAFPRGNCNHSLLKYFEGKDTFLKQPFKAKGRLWKQIAHFIQL